MTRGLRRQQGCLGKAADFKPAQYEKLLENDLSKGREQAEKIRQDEIAWITAGKDVGLEFQKKYLPVK